jgi:hypothetical protein
MENLECGMRNGEGGMEKKVEANKKSKSKIRRFLEDSRLKGEKD